MKKIIFTIGITGILALTLAFTAPTVTKLVSKVGHVNFFSHTAIEDITADNFKVVSTLNTETGTIVYSVPMQGFEFEKALMQKHYNSSKFLDTKKFPKSKFKGKITNITDINFDKDGTYNATVKGEMTLHGVTKAITETAVITIKGNKVIVETKLKLTLADYNINFKKGKPSTNIAKTIDVTSKSEYTKED
ncbi:YceI family protein [Lutibacter sp.]|uniref:YceI family protein n=1 Tax=Lutibacter sp. TaxID=1925666 RepID=UPI0025B9D492|nr:YceI family protein [Lutibacter sp.]MCF6169077.1 YceI family protein [Lutibacter sp.]